MEPYIKRKSFSSRSSVELSLLGSRVLIVRIRGSLNQMYLEGYLKERKSFIESLGLKDQRFIEIRDFSEMTRLSRELLKRIRKGSLLHILKDGKEQPLACYHVGLSLRAKMMFKLLSQPQLDDLMVENSSNIGKALIRGLNLLYEKRIFSYAETHRIKDREFLIELGLYRESVHFLTESDIYVDINGLLAENDVEPRNSSWNAILEAFGQKNKEIRVLMGLREQNISRADLEILLNSSWLHLLLRMGCVRLILLSSQDGTIRTAQELLTLGPIPFRVEKRLNDALISLVPQQEERRARPLTTEKTMPYAEDMEQLETYILNLQLDHSEKKALILSETLGEHHPFRPLYQAINMCYSRLADQFLLIQREKTNLSWKYKESVMWSGLYEQLYRMEQSATSGRQLVERFVETFNSLMEESRAHFFERRDKGYFCHLSSHIGSMEGVLIPVELINDLDEHRQLDLTVEDVQKDLPASLRLDHGPFIQSFFQKYAMERLILRLLGKDRGEFLLLVEIRNNHGREAESIAHLINTILSVVHHHFTEQENPFPNKSVNEVSTPPIGWQKVMEEYEDDEEFYQHVLLSFLKNLQGQVEEMQQSIDVLDLEKLRREAHKVKGGAGNLFAMDLYKAALALEESADQGSRDDLYEKLQAFIYEKTRVDEWCRDKWPES